MEDLVHIMQNDDELMAFWFLVAGFSLDGVRYRYFFKQKLQ